MTDEPNDPTWPHTVYVQVGYSKGSKGTPTVSTPSPQEDARRTEWVCEHGFPAHVGCLRGCRPPAPAPSDEEARLPNCLPSLGEPCGNCHRCAHVAAPTEDAAEADALAEVLHEAICALAPDCTIPHFEDRLYAGAAVTHGYRKVHETAQSIGIEKLCPCSSPSYSHLPSQHNWPDISGYLSPAQVREREAAAWDAGHRLTRPHSDYCEPTCPNPFRTGSAT